MQTKGIVGRLSIKFLCVTLPHMSIPGEGYMTIHVSRDRIGEGWMLMEKWRKDTKTKAANHQWVEEWTLDHWEWPCKDIKICYPIEKEQ